MVRVLMCHSFKDQKIFSDAYEPSTTGYSIAKDMVFICTVKGHVYVYSVSEDGFPLLCQFPLVSVATDMIFNDIGNFVFTREITRKDKPNNFTARVYFNWSKWREEFANHKTKVLQCGFSLAQSYSLEPYALTVVEMQTRSSVNTLSSCPVTTNIAVGTETTVLVYSRCVECPFDFQKLYMVEVGFSIFKVVICEQFIAITSDCELRVLQVTLPDGLKPPLENVGRDRETEQHLSQEMSLPSSCQREVFDENFVVWSFENYQNTSTELSMSWESILRTDEWSEEDKDGKSCWIDLASLKDEVPYIDYSKDACEVLGPVKTVHGHPIKVQAPFISVESVTMLYRYFDLMESDADSTKELHSLQLVPFYTSVFDENKKPLPQLSGMICFVSTSKQGFIYNVFSKTEFLTNCTYTAEITSATICNNLLYTSTSQELTTYVIPIYSAVAKHLRTMHPLEIEDKLNIDESVSNGTTDGDLLSTDNTSLVSNHDENVKSFNENKFTHFGFPVYDLEILQKPCPTPSVDLCMIGVHQFPGLFSMFAAGSRILLLTDITTSSSYQRHSKKSKKKDENATKDWTLHALEAMDMCDLYHKMESLTERSETLTADLRLLKEKHFILRSQFQVGNSSDVERQSLMLILKNSVKSIGHFYARYAADDLEDVVLYYNMANLSIEEILDELVDNPVDVDKLKEKTFGKGLLCYLNYFFFKNNPNKTCLSLHQATADKVLYIYSNADCSRLSTLILRPLIEGYTSEVAIKILIKLKKTKTYSFSTEDHLALAIVYLKTCSLDEAVEELLSLTKENLAEICVKHHYILYCKDESLTPLGQLLRRRLPEVFIKALVSLHLRNLILLKNTVDLLLGKDVKRHNNNHLIQFLELLLNDSRGTKSFKEAREYLVDIYLKKLSQKSSTQERGLIRLPHFHIPRGSGHFAKRFSWLDKLPPFNGNIAEPKDCPIMRANMVSSTPLKVGRKFPGFSRDRSNQVIAAGTGTASSCTCCCCWEILLKLQSILCSRYCDRDLGSSIINNLIGKSVAGEISITLLCLPLIGEYQKAVETLLLIDSWTILSYAKQYFGESYTKWRCVLDVLTQKICTEKEVSSNHTENLIEILKETLVILSKCTTPTVFLSLLPEDGNFAFFLPYLVKCCENETSKGLSNQIHPR
ncbi:uncharacterized protein LOC114518433 [Dendronephthya gigantea]|uniref:uncharacterized protein LOC114518433 n=1 Tax=Dendronephthya gigantea TaxID=151771 RepID=UPI00106C4A7E|nr:uncharacterized protein LOC114518433 [Dendronephthya gigantea]